MIRKFVREYESTNKIILLEYNKKIYQFIYMWFDGTNKSSYEKFYHNKIKDGFIMSLFDENGYIPLNIELGEELAVNFINSRYFGDSYDMDMIDVIYHIGRIFYYKEAIIYHNYKEFTNINNNKEKDIFKSLSMYNDTIYSYLKTGKKYMDGPFIEYKTGYWKLDEYFSKVPDNSILEKFPDKDVKTNKELLFRTIEKYFYLYPKIVEGMQENNNIFNNNYVTFNIYDKLVADGLISNFRPNIIYSNETIIDNDYKLIFRQPMRRFAT